MTFAEFNFVADWAYKYNGPFALRITGRPVVKYIDPHYDLRDGKVFCVTFRGFGSERTFHTQNECRDLPQSLYERCIAYLNGEETQ